jgi:hypothetical protein
MEVWLFDALYAGTDKFLAWLDQYHGRLLNLYTEHGGTKEETERLMATLKQRGKSCFAGKKVKSRRPNCDNGNRFSSTPNRSTIR